MEQASFAGRFSGEKAAQDRFHLLAHSQEQHGNEISQQMQQNGGLAGNLAETAFRHLATQLRSPRLHLAFSVGLLAIETHLPDAVSQRDLRREGSGGGFDLRAGFSEAPPKAKAAAVHAVPKGFALLCQLVAQAATFQLMYVSDQWLWQSLAQGLGAAAAGKLDVPWHFQPTVQLLFVQQLAALQAIGCGMLVPLLFV
ncbi:unnamed protein product [Symbiodinium microadriaticum]|nr:unnamed protein product [Symbiodinium microadriaticum]